MSGVASKLNPMQTPERPESSPFQARTPAHPEAREDAGVERRSPFGAQPPVGVGGAGGRPSVSSRTGDLLDGLNPQQLEAVTHTGSPLLIVAGSGSGKTAVLTRRIAYLMAERGVQPGQILAITFTNKAAAEMLERVAALVGPAASRMWVATFHSTCARWLRQHADLVPGLNSNFTIYDSDDSRRLLGMIAKERGLDTKRFTPRVLASAISNHKNDLVSAAEAAEEADRTKDPFKQTVAAVFSDYQRRLRLANAVDFDDLIAEMVRIFTEHKDVAEYWRRRFRHVLIDEYQDTNHAQYRLAAALVGKEPSGPEGLGAGAVPPSELCVVGDADQSIYAFRGATIRNIEEFERDYAHARTVLLEQNYRSTQTILSAANAVIRQNAGRREKKLWTENGDGEKITGYVADNEHDEARYVAGEIDRLVDSGTPYSDIAVMYRTNNASRALEDVFLRTGIPYKVVGGTRFYERREIRDIVAYLRVLDNPDDAVSLRRIINTPRRGIGDRAQAFLAVHADSHEDSYWQALVDAANGEVSSVGARGKNAVARFVDTIRGLQDEARDLATAGPGGLPDIGGLVSAVLDMTGYQDSLSQSNDPQDATRLDNLNELVSVAREFTSEEANRIAYEEMDGQAYVPEEGEPEPGSLQAFLERVSLVADADQIPEEEQSVVTLMTLHTAKGLEFPTVFLTGWEDGQFPHLRALGNPTELAEERRLAYVGITRARKHLYLTRAELRSSWGKSVMNPASRFLGDIPTDLVDWQRTGSESQGMGHGSWGGGYSNAWGSPGTSGGGAWGSSGYGSAGYGSGQRSGGRSGARTGGPKPKAQTGGNKHLELVVGDRVNHEKYGLGTVIEAQGKGPRATVMIDFGSSGKVRLMLIGGLPMEKL